MQACLVINKLLLDTVQLFLPDVHFFVLLFARSSIPKRSWT